MGGGVDKLLDKTKHLSATLYWAMYIELSFMFNLYESPFDCRQ
jgi:hypothetical protein